MRPYCNTQNVHTASESAFSHGESRRGDAQTPHQDPSIELERVRINHHVINAAIVSWFLHRQLAVVLQRLALDLHLLASRRLKTNPCDRIEADATTGRLCWTIHCSLVHNSCHWCCCCDFSCSLSCCGSRFLSGVVDGSWRCLRWGVSFQMKACGPFMLPPPKMSHCIRVCIHSR